MTAPVRHSRWPLFVMFGVLLLAIASYSAYWVHMSGELYRGVEEWMDDQREDGWTVEHGAMKMSGYPWRFRLDIASPHMTVPGGELDWRGETLTLVMQSYNLNHVIGFSDGAHDLRGPDGERVHLVASGAQGSYSWNKRGLKRLSLIVADLKADPVDAPGGFVAKGLNFHMSPMPDAVDDLRIMAGFDEIDLSEPVKGAEYLGETVGPLVAPLAVRNGARLLNASGDPRAILEALQPQIYSPLTQFSWGPLKAKLRSEGLGVDALNRPTGAFDLRLDDVETLKQAMRDADALEPEVEQVLTFAQALTGETSFLTFTLREGKLRYVFKELATVDPLF